MVELLRRAYDATWGKYVFAGMYDRYLGKAEKAGLAEKRKEMPSAFDSPLKYPSQALNTRPLAVVLLLLLLLIPMKEAGAVG
jgi:hypothetical protein